MILPAPAHIGFVTEIWIQWYEALEYFRTARKQIVYSIDEIKNSSTVLCGYWCLYYLYERQWSNRILDVIHNPHFDNDNSDFIKAYFSEENPQYVKKRLLEY